jgi:hypothetical protein
MTIKTKTAGALTALTVAAAIAIPTEAAQAKPKFGHIAAGLLGAAVVTGAVAAATANPYYYDGYRRCFWQPQYDVFGNFIGNAQVCRYY